MKRCLIILLVATAGWWVVPVTALAQVVSPLQTGHYTPGMQNVRDMSHPTPGLFPIWYNTFASGDKFIDKDGNTITNVNQVFPNLDVNLDYKIDTFATIPMVFWASDFTLLGGATYMAGLSVNYLHAEGTFTSERRTVIGDTTRTRVTEGSSSGFSDMFFLPLGLSWEQEKSSVMMTYGFAAPTGRFDVNADDNLGLGFWTHQFQGFGYFYPMADKSTALMLGLTYELNTKIKDTEVKPGNRFSLDYGISQYVSDRMELAVQGGHNWQITDDSGADVYWDAGVHDRKSSLGFYGNYWPWKGKLAVSVKYGFDYGARGRFVTNYWMLNVLFIPNLLTGS